MTVIRLRRKTVTGEVGAFRILRYRPSPMIALPHHHAHHHTFPHASLRVNSLAEVTLDALNSQLKASKG